MNPFDTSTIAGLYDASIFLDESFNVIPATFANGQMLLVDEVLVEIRSDGQFVVYDYLGDELDAFADCYEFLGLHQVTRITENLYEFTNTFPVPGDGVGEAFIEDNTVEFDFVGADGILEGVWFQLFPLGVDDDFSLPGPLCEF